MKPNFCINVVFTSAVQEGLNLSHSAAMSEANSLPDYRSGSVSADLIHDSICQMLPFCQVFMNCSLFSHTLSFKACLTLIP